MWCEATTLTILAFEQEDTILRNLGHPEVIMYDAPLEPLERVVHTKLVFLITVSEDQSYVLWFEVTNSFHAHLQDDMIALLRPNASLKKQNGQFEWIGTCSILVEPFNPVSRVNSLVI